MVMLISDFWIRTVKKFFCRCECVETWESTNVRLDVMKSFLDFFKRQNVFNPYKNICIRFYYKHRVHVLRLLNFRSLIYDHLTRYRITINRVYTDRSDENVRFAERVEMRDRRETIINHIAGSNFRQLLILR